MNDPDENRRQVIDAESGRPLPTRRIDLSNLRDIRLELAHIYRRVDCGAIESQDGTRRAYMLRVIADILVSAELEKRIDKLEARSALHHHRGAT